MTIKEILQAIKDLLSKVHNCDAALAAKDAEIAQLKTDLNEAITLKAELEALLGGGFNPSGN